MEEETWRRKHGGRNMEKREKEKKYKEKKENDDIQDLAPYYCGAGAKVKGEGDCC